MSSKSGLGRGFDALLPQDFDAEILSSDHERIKYVPLNELKPNPKQPRQHFDEDALKELACSIEQYGLLQPLVAKPTDRGYEIVAGERRWRASQLAGLETVPVIVRSVKELEQLEIAIVENVQRVDLSPLEQAASIERLHDQFSMTYDTIAKRLGRSLSAVHNVVRLLQLPAAAIEALHTKKITEGHARAILALKGKPDSQADLLDSILKCGWSVRQAERYVVSVKDGYEEKKAAVKRADVESPQTRRLSKKLGVTVQVRRMAKGGKLELRFRSDEELERLYALLG